MDIPKTVRPKTQLGFDLRARRRNADWGLGEAGRSRKEADIAINRRYPIWGRVDSEAMKHERPSALKALEMLQGGKGAYQPGRGRKKHTYETAKEVAAVPAELTAERPSRRMLPPLAEVDRSAAQQSVQRASEPEPQRVDQRRRSRDRRASSLEASGSGVVRGGGGHTTLLREPRRATVRRSPSDAASDPRVARLAREMHELAASTERLAMFRSERLSALAEAERSAGRGRVRLPSPNTAAGRRQILNAKHVDIAGRVNEKLEAAVAEKTARCVKLSEILTAEYGDLSTLM